MNDLDDRLASLRHHPQPDRADAGAIHRRAEHRIRRRRTALGAAAVLAVVAGAVGVLALDRRDAERIETTPVDRPAAVDGAPAPPPSPDPPGPTRTLGDGAGVTVEVTPRTDLTDGALVDVRIEGVAALPGALILMCAGDIDAENAASSCDTTAVQRPDADVNAQVTAEAMQTVSVARFIHIPRHPSDPNQNVAYDCATEPAGCGIAVAPFSLPATGVFVPVSFRADPVTPAQLTLAPATGLADGATVAVDAEGVRPNGGFTLQQCRADGTCDELAWPHAESDGDGRLRGTIVVRAALYTYQGRTDCTADDCSVRLLDAGGTMIAEAPLGFGADVVAPMPRLTIEPEGPYVADQEVEVRGTGFPPGIDIGSQLGQCPADLDTAVAERCSRPAAFTSVVVAADGTFRVPIRLSDNLIFTGSCVTGPGCVLGWVIPHGPTVTAVPLTFAP